MNEDEIELKLEREFAMSAGKVFADARKAALKSGLSVVESDDGIVSRVYPNWDRVEICKIPKPIRYTPGQEFKIFGKPMK